MPKLYQRVTAAALALALFAQPFTAGAIDLDSAFTGLMPGGAVAVNAPGRYSSAARTGLSVGGVDIRVPRGENAPALFSVTPPRVTAGCSGISAHFGGFSFISGQEFVNLLKQIASGAALGFVSSLVMKQLCPQCEAVVQEMKSAAQAASRLAKDSCEIGQNWAKDMKLGLTTEGNTSETCATLVADAGGASDPLMAFSTTCKGLEAAKNAIRDFGTPTTRADGTPMTAADREATQALIDCTQNNGNATWGKLSALDGAGKLQGIGTESNLRKLILTNLMGADMTFKSNSAEVGCETGDGTVWVASESSPSNFCAPPLDTATLTGIFLCGAPDAGGNFAGATSSRVRSYCASFFPKTASGTLGEVWTCKKSPVLGAANDFSECNYLDRVPVGEVFQGTGFLTQVNNILREGVKRVRNGQSMLTDSPSDQISGQQVLQLINAAPFPLYQAINAAAVYPAAADDLVDSMSLLVAEQFTYAMLDEILKVQGRSSTGVCITQPQAAKLLDFIASLRSASNDRRSLIAQNFTVQQMLVEQIRQVNLAIQKQVMSQDLLATGRLGQTLNNAITSNGGNQAAPSATP